MEQVQHFPSQQDDRHHDHHHGHQLPEGRPRRVGSSRRADRLTMFIVAKPNTSARRNVIDRLPRRTVQHGYDGAEEQGAVSASNRMNTAAAARVVRVKPAINDAAPPAPYRERKA